MKWILMFDIQGMKTSLLLCWNWCVEMGRKESRRKKSMEEEERKKNPFLEMLKHSIAWKDYALIFIIELVKHLPYFLFSKAAFINLVLANVEPDLHTLSLCWPNTAFWHTAETGEKRQYSILSYNPNEEFRYQEDHILLCYTNLALS